MNHAHAPVERRRRPGEAAAANRTVGFQVFSTETDQPEFGGDENGLQVQARSPASSRWQVGQ
jgi:hypothetical protein